MTNQTVLILDFGGQYKELIARRVRECGVYSIIEPYDTPISTIKEINPIGIIFTGGPNSVYLDDSPVCEPELYKLGIPMLGICYGMQLIAYMNGGTVSPCEKSEYGRINTIVDNESVIFSGLDKSQITLMSHTDHVSVLPEGFNSTAHTDTCGYAAYECPEKKLYGVQFHPEVENTPNGTAMIRNFLYNVCGAKGDYSMDDYLKRQIEAVRERVGDKRILLGLSGGVDSSVCAALLSEAVGDRLICIYIDHGFMRKHETDEIKAVFEKRNLNFVYVDAEERFLSKMKGVTDPEEKRKIIGREFINTFEDEAKKQGNPEFFAQGTIYPDVVESGNKNKSAVIKSHHNVGGLPDRINFEGIIEPLSHLFKDEVRQLGRMLGLPESLVSRQPFPGPGLSIRIIGEVTKEKCDILRSADYIFRTELAECKETAAHADQYFAVLTDTKSVGVMGDFRTYEYALVLRAVITSDFMTCRFAPLPYDLLERVSSRITNEVRGINRVTYDITSKPPATIEWE